MPARSCSPFGAPRRPSWHDLTIRYPNTTVLVVGVRGARTVLVVLVEPWNDLVVTELL
ncbi:hypothetical protein I551_8043 [Mycobacterium ulcerans str. Harvey]|uniref:Uncharacterized protein n=1 Tax=Mycobacterium ulcerans str. Harvey TaxID=1299332 RepID=A0ABP3A7J3_MYCUL|nr:hypothetical protein I551_8043 [Mycobacterium ulcerans str. Harvey]